MWRPEVVGTAARDVAMIVVAGTATHSTIPDPLVPWCGLAVHHAQRDGAVSEKSRLREGELRATRAMRGFWAEMETEVPGENVDTSRAVPSRPIPTWSTCRARWQGS